MLLVFSSRATMSSLISGEFSENDLQFLLEIAAPDLRDKIGIIRGDPAFAESILENHATEIVRRLMLMKTDDMLVMITPRFLFELLIRSARKEMATQAYTMERTALERIPVFDAAEVLRFIKDDAILKYLAGMLNSFTRIRSFTLRVRLRKGVWRRTRFNDMDIGSLLRFCEATEEERRFDLYKRIADLCLFTVGVFPEYLNLNGRASTTGIPMISLRHGWSGEDYEEGGRRFYRLASEHPDACVLRLNSVLWRLHESFGLAKKPLNFISEHYLEFRKGNLFSGSRDVFDS